MKKYIISLCAFMLLMQIVNAQTVQYLPLYDDNTFTKPLNMEEDVPVGTTAGALDVSSSGGASFSIPIPLPPGTKGIAPSVAVGYNSQGGNGIMGMGWNMSASSAITRMGKNFTYDGAVTAINLDYTDMFALDGNRLEMTSGSLYGQYGSTYATKMETFSKITIDGSGNFLVEAKNGMKYQYGNTPDSQLKTEDDSKIISWYLNKSYDQYGNYIEYVYEKIGREIRLKEINYTGNNTISPIIAPYNKVKFNYLERADKNTLYTSGSSVALNSLLTEIVVTTEGGALVRKFQFNYAKDELNHSFLQEVVEYGSDATQLALNSTIFKYKSPSLTINKVSSLTLDAGYEIVGTGDYNGDGLTDIIAVTYDYHVGANPPKPQEISNLATYLKNPNDNGYTKVFVKSFPTDTYGTSLTIKYNSKTQAPQSQDFDGDGKDEILVFFVKDNNVVAYDLYSLNNNSIQYDKWTNNPRGGGNTGTLEYQGTEGCFSVINPQVQFATTGDFDGDGITDILALLRDCTNADNAKLILFKPSKTVEAQRSCFVESYFTASQLSGLFAGSNIDADGKQELIFRFKNPYSYDVRQVTGIKPSSTSTPTTPKYQLESMSGFDKTYDASLANFKLGDFNGDGNTDIVYKNTYANSVYYEYSTGKNYVTGATIVFPSNMQDWAVGDFNGDGITDIVCSYKNCTYYPPYPQCIPNCGNGTNCTLYFDVYYSTGSGFVKKTYSDSYYDSSLGNNSNGVMTIGDYNGDGKTDILVNQAGYFSTFSFNPNGNDFLLEKVQNAFMQTSTVSYKSIAEPGIHYSRTEASSYPLNVTKPAIKVATSVTSPNGIGGTTTVNYKYENARLHRSGLGFLGFGKVTVDNPTQNAQVVTETEILTPQYLPAVKTVRNNQIVNNVVTPLSVTTNTNSVSVNGTRYWMKVDGTVSNNIVTGGTMSSSSTYDANGNVSFIASHTNGEEDSYVWSNAFGDGYDAFGNPYLVYSYKERVGEQRLYQSRRFTYNAQGDVLTITEDDIDQGSVSGWQSQPTTTNTYSSTGNLLTTTISSPSLQTKTSTFEYDTKFRYVTKTTNPLGQFASKTYDPRWGTVATEKDVAGLTTTYTYDGFGRLTNTLTPQGHNITMQYLWAYNGQNLPIRCYDIVTTIPGKPSSWDTYDVLGRKTVATHENYGDKDHRWVYTYNVTEFDVRGNILTTHTPVNATDWASREITTYSYDEKNRLSTAVNSIGTTTYGYSPPNAGKSTVTVTNPAGQTSSKTTEASGKVISTTDNGGTLTFDYYSSGNQKAVKLGGMIISSMTYDSRGNQLTLFDKNAGTTSYNYNAYGELTGQQDANANAYTMTYDILGRLLTRTGPEGTTTNEYVPFSAGYTNYGVNQIKKITGFNGITEEYVYDSWQRATQAKETIDNVAYTKSFTYRLFNNKPTGDVETVTYPSGLVVTNAYSVDGYLYQVSSGNQMLFDGSDAALGKMNGFGKWQTYKLGNGITSSTTYNTWGMATNYLAPSKQNLTLNWHLPTGNLTSRIDGIKNNLTESFGYNNNGDNLNRLTSATVSGQAAMNFNYAPNGNITSKSDVGTYIYDPTKINAVTSITSLASPATISTNTQDIIYTKFQRPEKITEGGYELTFLYAADYERRKTVLKQGTTVIDTRLFMGDYEIDTRNGVTRYIHYISGGDGLCSIVVKEGTGGFQFFFPYSDHLGSILTVTDKDGTVVAEQNFDAWGRRRNPNAWDYNNVTKWGVNNAGTIPDWLYRGYTGHEHLPEFGLINMNARLYDPVLGRMLSVDNFVGDGGSQAFNRYSYAGNNPLNRVDPSGNFWHIVIGAVIGGAINVATHWDKVKSEGLGAGFDAFVIGAIGGGITAATGGAAAGFFATGGAAAAATAGALTGTFSSGIIGGAISGSVGALIGSPIQALGNHLRFGDGYSSNRFIQDVITGGIAGGIAGGISARIQGNNIWSNAPKGTGTTGWTRPSINDKIIRGEGWTRLMSGKWVQVPGFAIHGFGELSKVVDPKTISELLTNGGVYNGNNNGFLGVSDVEKYYNQMANGSFDPVKNTVGGFMNGSNYVITEGNHRVAAAAWYGLRSGNYNILNGLINNGRFSPQVLSGYSISKFPLIWNK